MNSFNADDAVKKFSTNSAKLLGFDPRLLMDSDKPCYSSAFLTD